MMLEQETRNTPGQVEFRAGAAGLGTLTGLASVFNKRSQDLGGFVEQVHPFAFRKSLADKVPVIARFNHSDDHPLGTTAAGTLRLSVESGGLRYDVDLPDTQAGRDVKVLAERGDLRYSSFAFRVVEDRWDQTEDGMPLRTLLSVKLVDVAPVMNPAYLQTTSGMRSLAGHLGIDLDTVQRAARAGDLRSLLAGSGLPRRRQASKAPQIHPGAAASGVPSLAELRRRLDFPPPVKPRVREQRYDLTAPGWRD
jgi:HK97 family phage prohead protease